MQIDTDRTQRLKQYLKDEFYQKKVFGVPWKTDKLEDFKVYRIRTEVLSFNFDNARIAAEKISLEGKLARILDPRKDEDQKKVQKILLESIWFAKGDTEQLKKSLEVQQRNPAIVTFDGVVIDGNRRLACIRQLHDDKGEPRYEEIDICVLPQASKKELTMLENRLQLAKDYKVDYGAINNRLRFREMLRNEEFTMSEIIFSVNDRYNESEIRKYVDEMDLIDDYLTQIGRPKDYTSISDKTESFSNLLTSISASAGNITTAKANIENEKIKVLGYQIISHPDSTYVHIRKFRDILKKPQARKELLENSPTYNNFGKGNPFELPRLEEEFENLDLAYGFVKSIKSDPKKLAQQALQKLELIDSERVPKKNSEFISILEKIEKKLNHIKKKM